MKQPAQDTYYTIFKCLNSKFAGPDFKVPLDNFKELHYIKETKNKDRV